MVLLEVYGDCNVVYIDVFVFYVNQQGYMGGKYLGDIIGLFDGVWILLLEVKELDYFMFIVLVFYQFNFG